MNKVILTGRLTSDAEIRYSQGDNPLAVGRFTLAVDRRVKKNENEPHTDFIRCVSFGKQAEFCEKYAKKGIKFVIVGRIQTGKYTNKEGQTVYTTDIVVEEMEFSESRKAVEADKKDAYMDVDREIEEDLPFN